MIPCILVGAVCFFVGVFAGVAGHSSLKKDMVDVTVLELTGWAQRLRNAESSDVQAAKEKIRSLVNEIEKRL